MAIDHAGAREHGARNGEDRVAGDAAESGRQGPAVRGGQERGGRGGGENAGDPQAQTQRRALDAPAATMRRPCVASGRIAAMAPKPTSCIEKIGGDRARAGPADCGHGRRSRG